MGKTRQILILGIIAAAATAGGLIAINPFGASSVQANQGGTSGAQKWEYCAITDFQLRNSSLGSRPIAFIRYYQIEGAKVEEVEFAPAIGKRADIKDALNKAIAKLGDEGWEMVLKDSDGIFHFKRPKQ